MKDSVTRTAEVLGGRKEGGAKDGAQRNLQLEQEEWREVREAGRQEGAEPAAPAPSGNSCPPPAGWLWAQDKGESTAQPGPRQGSHLPGARQEPPAEATAPFAFISENADI